MRRVTLDGEGFEIEDDPKSVLRDFLGFALSPSEDGRPIEEKLAPRADGVACADIMGATPARFPEDLDGDERELKEPWVVYTSFPGRVPSLIVLEGEELRHLLG